MESKKQHYLKMEKGKNFSMKKGYMMFGLLFLSMFFMINMASGLIYWQKTLLGLDNVTTTYFAQLTYDSTRFDEITAGKPLEVYVLYEAHIPLWNNGSDFYDISLCNLSIYYSKRYSSLENPSINLSAESLSLLYERMFYDDELTGEVDATKYFIQITQGDSVYVYFKCSFENPNYRILNLPVSLAIVEPTTQCKACQLYNWQTEQIKLNKAVSLSDYTNDNVGFIKDFLRLFFENFYIMFWVILIVAVLLAVALIFYAIGWGYSAINKLAKKT